ncbi:Rieske (2Fe-2S) protein [Amycolatopsis alkalitolerans]|uniref:Rieske (2Fe-2S) protein n=1 Tax=Amycolatopsis alkalitolerans TaxID=2547244 RepID=A0A5C4LYS2_9PSEU|nr:Rieske (2Fe-2S) protein [Amycolatopsis alkalitolerans]TNC23428.1 Rieske (2Fe-2S) protein [Amycolatopsis alkalitolerans]
MWVYAAELAELARRKKKRVTIGEDAVALFLVDGEVYALADVCVHKGRSLSRGTLWRASVICPGHQWAFDPETGRAEDQDACQPTYAVEVRDGKVFVDPVQRVTSEAT